MTDPIPGGRSPRFAAAPPAVALALAILAGCDRTYDLRGPAPQPGCRVAVESTTTISNGTFRYAAGATVDGAADLTIREAGEIRYLRVDRCRPTDYTYHVGTHAARYRFITPGGATHEEAPPFPLDGREILFQHAADGWDRQLVDPGRWAIHLGRPYPLPTTRPASPEERRAIEELPIPDAVGDDGVYPDQPVPVGHTWVVTGRPLAALFGGGSVDPRAVRGEANLVFEQIADVDGEPCAQVAVTLRVSGSVPLKPGAGAPARAAVTADLRGTTWRSLKTGLERRTRLEGHMEFRDDGTGDGGDPVTVTIAGPVTVVASARMLVDGTDPFGDRPRRDQAVQDGLAVLVFATAAGVVILFRRYAAALAARARKGGS